MDYYDQEELSEKHLLEHGPLAVECLTMVFLKQYNNKKEDYTDNDLFTRGIQGVGPMQ